MHTLYKLTFEHGQEILLGSFLDAGADCGCSSVVAPFVAEACLTSGYEGVEAYPLETL